MHAPQLLKSASPRAHTVQQEKLSQEEAWALQLAKACVQQERPSAEKNT